MNGIVEVFSNIYKRFRFLECTYVTLYLLFMILILRQHKPVMHFLLIKYIYVLMTVYIEYMATRL